MIEPAAKALKSSDGAFEPVWSFGGPALFVLLWSTGFIGAKGVLPHSEPFTVLAMRFGVAGLLFALIAPALGAQWPRTAGAILHSAVVGLLMYGGYLTSVFWAMSIGTPAWLAALIAGLQPLLTAVLVGPLLGEMVNLRQWSGFALGFFGVGLVIWDDFGTGGGSVAGFTVLFLGLACLSGGTLYQKRFGQNLNMWSGQVIQHAAGFAWVAALALVFETGKIHWTAEFVAAFSWLTFVLSIGMFSLLYALIRRGAVSKVSSLFFLVPPLTAVEAHLLFGETLSLAALAGMAAAAVGVALVTVGER